MNLSKLTTEQLKKKIADGKIPADQLEAATALLTKRESTVPKDTRKTKDVKKKAPKKKEEKPKEEKKAPKAKVEKKEKPAKKEAVEKVEPKVSTIADYDTSDKTVSGLVKKMLLPKDEKSKVAGCTYGQADKAVRAKFNRKLHTSEFQRNFDVLKGLGILEEKLPPRYQSEEEKAAKEKGDKKKDA